MFKSVLAVAVGGLASGVGVGVGELSSVGVAVGSTETSGVAVGCSGTLTTLKNA
jgi:hypothetical protein